jgi:hypothetical protein
LTALDHHRSKLTAVAALSDKFRRELDDRLAGLCYCTLSCCSEIGLTEWWTTFFHWITNARRDRMMMRAQGNAMAGLVAEYELAAGRSAAVRC